MENKSVIKEQTRRNSAIELLRIICMLLIIMNHYSYYGNWGELCYETLSWQRVLIQMIHCGGTIAVDVFILITGFFSFGRKTNWKRYILLILEMYFYSIIIYIILVATGIISFSFEGMIKAMLPIMYGNWFCVYYVLFFLLIPFVNELLQKLSKEQFTKLLLVWMIIWSIVPTILHGWHYGHLATFFGMYLWGAYISKFGIQEKVWTKIGIAALVLLLLSPIAIDILGVVLKSNTIMSKASYFDTNSCILTVLAAIALFLLFKNWKMQSKMVNLIAASVLGIYLIHDNENIRSWLWTTWWANNDYLDSNLLPIHMLIKVSIIFCACLVIDLLRRYTIEKVAIRWIDKNWKKIKNENG